MMLTWESMPLLIMICFLRNCSSALGFLRVDLGVGTGFLLFAGDPGAVLVVFPAPILEAEVVPFMTRP